MSNERELDEMLSDHGDLEGCFEELMDDEDDGQPIGSCDDCGCDCFADEDDGSGLCDQCQWRRNPTV